MARQINLFAFTGKLGDVVGYNYKGNYYSIQRSPGAYMDGIYFTQWKAGIE